jgi:deoxycytidine triphosphate deaminase
VYAADRDIKALLPAMALTAPNPAHTFSADDQVQPCSVDLRVSNVFWRPSRRRLLRRRVLPGGYSLDLRHSALHDIAPLRDWKRIELGEGDAITIRPGQTVMGRIYERFRIPDEYAGKIEGRSSFARLGLAVHATGDFINPGWEGYMPLQLFNAGPYPLKLTPYLPICQLLLVQLSSTPERSYGNAELQSKYINDDGGPSLWWRDALVRVVQERLGEVNVSERVQRQIVGLVRFESPDILERFEHFVRRRRVGNIDNADELLESFAVREDLRRLVDTVSLASPAITVGVLAACLFAKFATWHLLVAGIAVLSCIAAATAYLRRDSGYLGRSELQRARNENERNTA